MIVDPGVLGTVSTSVYLELMLLGVDLDFEFPLLNLRVEIDLMQVWESLGHHAAVLFYQCLQDLLLVDYVPQETFILLKLCKNFLAALIQTDFTETSYPRISL